MWQLGKIETRPARTIEHHTRSQMLYFVPKVHSCLCGSTECHAPKVIADGITAHVAPFTNRLIAMEFLDTAGVDLTTASSRLWHAVGKKPEISSEKVVKDTLSVFFNSTFSADDLHFRKTNDSDIALMVHTNGKILGVLVSNYAARLAL